MAGSNTALYRGSLFINYGRYGWSETFDFLESDQEGAQLSLNNLAQLRAWLLPAEAIVAYGRLAVFGQKRQSIAALGGPIPGKYGTIVGVTSNAIHDPSTALLFRVQAQENIFGMRFIRGIESTLIVDTAPAFTIPASWTPNAGAVNNAVLPTPTDFVSAMQNYLTYYQAYCAIYKKILTNPGQQPPVFQVQALGITGFLLRGVRNKKTGHPFDLSRGRQLAH